MFLGLFGDLMVPRLPSKYLWTASAASRTYSLTPPHGTDVCFLAHPASPVPGMFLQVPKVALQAVTTPPIESEQTHSQVVFLC